MIYLVDGAPRAGKSILGQGISPKVLWSAFTRQKAQRFGCPYVDMVGDFPTFARSRGDSDSWCMTVYGNVGRSFRLEVSIQGGTTYYAAGRLLRAGSWRFAS